MEWNKNLTLKESIQIREMLDFADKLIGSEVIDNRFNKVQILIRVEYIFNKKTYFSNLAIRR